MAKNLTITVALILVFAAGIGFAIYQDPERKEHQLFLQAIQQFALQAENIEKQFLSNQLLPPFNNTLQLDYADIQDSSGQIELNATMVNNQVTLRFGDGDSLLANQTIILQPVIEQQQVKWKCLNGSVLLRFRIKACRLGETVDIKSL